MASTPLGTKGGYLVDTQALTMDKRFKALKAIADRHGFVLYSQKRHLKWRHPCGAKVTTGMTVSDHRAHRNIDNQFRKTLELHQEAA